MRDSAWRLADAEFRHETAEVVAVFGKRDAARGGSEDFRAGRFHARSNVQRRLSAELHYRPVAMLPLVYFHDILERERLEVQPVGCVVVGGNCFRVGVDHHDFVPQAPQFERRVAAAPIELDALADAVGSAAEYHDCLAPLALGGWSRASRRWCGARVAGIVVWRFRLEFAGACIDFPEFGSYAKRQTPCAYFVFAFAGRICDLLVAEAERFGLPEKRRVHRGFSHVFAKCFDFCELRLEPRVEGIDVVA